MVFGYDGLEEEFKTTNTFTAHERASYDKVGCPSFEGLESVNISDTKNSFLFGKLLADLNKLSGIFCLHNGTDGQCVEFPHGHVHGIVSITGRPDNCRPLSRLKNTVKDLFGYLKTDACTHPTGLLQYLEQSPRQYIMATNYNWRDRRIAARSDGSGMSRAYERQQVRDRQCRRKDADNEERKMANIEDTTVNLMGKMSGEEMRKFTCENILEYLECFMKSKRCFEITAFLEYISGKRSLPNIARQNLKRMYSRSNFNTLWIKASDITIESIRREKFTDKLSRIKNIDLLSKQIMMDKHTSVDNSIAEFDLLMESWGCNKKKFLGELFAVLGKVLPKRNSFSLIGESNSGKSLLMRSLLPVFDDIVGGTKFGWEGSWSSDVHLVG
jgi:hypothetical protein